MKQTNILNWGIVSTGRIADKFCQDMAFVTNGKLKAVAGRDLERTTKFALKHEIEKAHLGYQALFDDDEIDVIYVATPHNFHFQHAYDALMAGKSVLCEKPITTSSQEAKVLTDLAKQKKLFLMEAMWSYFLPAVIKAKQWLNQGRIGKIKHIKADFGYAVPFDPLDRMYNPVLAGGCLLDMGIYPLAIAQYFHPAPLSEINIKVQKAETGVEQDLVILAKANEVILSLASSFQCRLQNAALIIGDKGYIHIPNFWRARSCSLYQTDTQVDSYEDKSQALGYYHEAQAAGEAIMAGSVEHKNVPHKVSILLQSQMEQIKSMF